MPKLTSIFIALIILSFVVAPAMVSAQVPPAAATGCKMRNDLDSAEWVALGFTCPVLGSACAFDSATYTCGPCCAMDTVYTVTNWFFVAVMALVIVFVLMGAYKLLFAGGDPKAVETGRTYVLYAAAGAVVALLAKAIPSIARAVLRV